MMLFTRFNAGAGAMAVTVFALAFHPTTVCAQTQEAKLAATDAAAGDQFGQSVAIDGIRAIVGAHLNDAAPIDCGAAYVYRLDTGMWVQEAQLLAADRATGDNFGISVAISGDWAVVGAPEDDDAGLGSGSVYVFQRSGFTWIQHAKLVATDGASGNRFGISVAIDGTIIAVGADHFGGLGGTGAVYVYRLGTPLTSHEARLTASDGPPGDNFGRAVSVSGSTVVAGAPLDDDGGSASGSAYVFVNTIGAIWAQETKLIAADDAAGDQFGASVSISGSTAAVGARLSDPAGTSGAGAAYVFDRSGVTWSQSAKLTAYDAAENDNFGNAISISGDALAVGAFLKNGQFGSFYMFRLESGQWNTVYQRSADDVNTFDQFGNALALSADLRLAVGSAAHDSGGLLGDNRGAAYIFNVSGKVYDSDFDDLSDRDELFYGLNPHNGDSDDDFLLDGEEVALAGGDFDGCPDPTNPDTDNDGDSDWFEIFVYMTNPCDGFGDVDTDGDGLLDSTELDMAMGSGCPDPLNPDSDGDGLEDGEEVLTIGSCPCNADTDGDLIPDDIDPNPIVADNTTSFLASYATMVANELGSIEPSQFLAPNANSQMGRRNVLTSHLATAASAINAGNNTLALAMLYIVKGRLDDESASPPPLPPDWLTPSSAKSGLYADVTLLIDILEIP